jgi:hypothetical protein
MEQIHSSETKTLNYYRNSLRSRNLQLVRQINPLPILCGLVVSVADYKHRGPGFDSRALLRIFLRELGL